MKSVFQSNNVEKVILRKDISNIYWSAWIISVWGYCVVDMFILQKCLIFCHIFCYVFPDISSIILYVLNNAVIWHNISLLLLLLRICFLFPATMGRPLQKIKKLNDSKSLWKIVVRVVDMWTVANSKNKQHIEMVLCDKEVVFKSLNYVVTTSLIYIYNLIQTILLKSMSNSLLIPSGWSYSSNSTI